MTSVHQELIARISYPQLTAVLLDTPFGFQQNADEIAARIIAYFRQHVGCEIRLASFHHSGQATALEVGQFLTALGHANYVFAGPGSPTYALHHWRDQPVRDRLIGKVTRGGCLAFSSAAAIGLGAYALPVCEIYKVGDDPSWMEGLDVLGEIGVRCAVIPPLQQPRGRDAPHPVLLHGRAAAASPRIDAARPSADPGRRRVHRMHHRCGGAIRDGARTRRGHGPTPRGRTTLGTDNLSVTRVAGSVGRAQFGHPQPARARWRRCLTNARADPAMGARGRDALDRRDVGGVVAAILEMENVLYEWRADLAGTDEPDRARAEMHHLLVRLGKLVRSAAQDDVREHVAPLVDVLVSLRGEARHEQRFDDADHLRAILAQCGVEVEDTPSGTGWSLAAT